MASEAASPRPLLTALALAGAADVGAFIATNPAVALKNSGRASGSVGGLVIWVLLLAVAGRRVAADDRRSLVQATVVLSALAALGGMGLAVIHQLAGVGGWRTLAGGVLGVAALGLAVAARNSSSD